MELVGIKPRIEEFLNKNKRSLEYMESLFSIDDNRDREEEFYKEGKLKILCVYLTAASSRAVSNTHNALSSLSKKLDPDNIVVDSCYFPEDGNLDVFRENNIPYIFGSTCHEPIGFYDLVLMSNAVCPEVLNIPRFLFYSGVGLTIEQRDKQDIPLICYGGAAANETSIVLGPIYRDGECIGKSLVDIGDYGYGEKSLATLAKTLLEWKNQGVNLHNKILVKEKLIDEGVLHDYLFFPEHYEWVYEDDKFTIKEIKCLDDRLPKQVKYARIRLNDDMGWTNKAFNLSGDNADSHDLMISSGCSGGSSNCSFCMEASVAGGYREKRLEDVEEEMKHTVRNCAPNTISWYCMSGDTKVLTEEGYKSLRYLSKNKTKFIQTTKGMSEYEDVVSTGVKKVLRVTTDRGYQIVATPEHWVQELKDNFDYENYKPKASDRNNSECLNYLAGQQYARGLLLEESTNDEEMGQLNDELYRKMLTENSYRNQRAFIAGYIQNGGNLVRISDLIDKVTEPVVPLSLEWRQLGTMNVGDYLPIYHRSASVYDLDILWYVAGRWYGDGSTPSKYNLMLHFGIQERDICKKIAELVGDGISSIREGSGTVYIIFNADYSKKIKSVISSKDCDLLDEVGRGTDSQIASFVAGLWDSDGTVSGNKCRFVSIREDFIKDLQVLLLRLGVYTRFDKTRQDGFTSNNEFIYGVTISGKRSYEGFSNLPMIQKIITREDSRIGRERDVYPIKSKVFREITKSKYRQMYSEQNLIPQLLQDVCNMNESVSDYCEDVRIQNYHFDKIVSIEEEYVDTYDVINTETADYIANGVVVGNSYNLNYYYRFMDLLATGANYFSGVTLLNERLDVVANSPEQMKLAKKLGLKRFSGPVEGAGERIRDGFLNKNLSRETLMKATHVISDLGLMHFKFGMILTGQETEDDMKEFLSEIDEMIKIRDEHGANHSYQINFTPLVFYSQIALRWMPRITAENSYNNARTMGWFIEETRKRNIRCKFNGKGCGTWLEQMLLDFGPAGTDWMVGLVLDEGLGYVRFFGDKIKEASCRQLDKRGYTNHLFFTKARPENWIFPNDHILSIPVALQRMWWERTKLWNEGDPQAFHKQLCLRTPANLNDTKCYGCQMCETPEEIKFMVKRELKDEHTYDEVAEMLSESREQKTVRVVVKQNSKWFFYNRTALAHYITSRFLQANDDIANQFFSVGKTTTTWLSNNGQKGWYGGTWCFDINLRDRVSITEFNNVIDKVNSVLESCQVLRVIDDTKTMKVKRETKVSYIGQTSAWSLSQIKDKLSMFEWDIKVPIKSMGGGLDTEIKHLPELKNKVLFAQKGQSVIIGMDLPASISPYFVMSSILGKGYEKMLADFSFDIIDQTADTDMVDDKGQHIGYSYFTNKYNQRANIETIRLYLYKLTH